MRILVVEDYGPIRGAVVTALRDEGWTVELAGDGSAALQMLRDQQSFDLVVLDLMLPGMDGPTLLRTMRAEGIDAHVLVVTARDEVESRVAVLNDGADDYLMKPFAMEELVARARALLRRHYAKKSPLIEVGPLTIRTTDHRVTMSGDSIDLTAREYALLEYFAFRAGEIVSRDDLHASLYGQAGVSAASNVVDVYVGYLRKKLEARGEPRILHTRRGEGYILAASEVSGEAQATGESGMSSPGSLQRRMSLAALLTVSLSLGASGFLVERSVRRRIVTEAESSLDNLLRISSMRVCSEARAAARSGESLIETGVFSSIEQHAWLVLSPPEALVPAEPLPGVPEQLGKANQELVRTAAFPIADPLVLLEALPDRGAARVQFVELVGEDGSPYRIATRIATPAEDAPPRRGPRGDGPRGERPRDDQLGGTDRRPLRLRRGGDRRPPPDPGPRFSPGEHYRIFVTASMVEERAVLSGLVRTLLWAGTLAIMFSFGLLSLSVRRGLRPVREISAEISRVQASRLDQHLALDDVPAELAPVVDAFEGTRERLAAAFRRERRFTSDAAHELRTPLAGLRASIEVALRRERSPEDYRATFQQCLEVTHSMEGMVETLLKLAKGASVTEAAESIRLADAVRSAFDRCAARLAERQLTFRYEGDPDQVLVSHRPLVDHIIANLTSNAASYALAGSEIRVVAVESDGGVELRFVNEVARLDAEVAQRAFEPLWRGDSARTDANHHAGLGLSLVKQCVDALSGTAEIRAEGSRFEIVLSLPPAGGPEI